MNRVYALDGLRFFAAMSVVLYHYAFAGYLSNKMTLVNFQDFGHFFKYGFLGVELFFMISGFVILMTAQNKKIIAFITSRVTRLYPAFWMSVSLTALVIVLAGGERYNVDLKQYLINLTMVSDTFHVKYIDGVYWTLLVEIKFYLLIGVLIVFSQIDNIKRYLFFWLLLSLINYYIELPRIVTFFLIPEYAPYFIGGAMFYIGYKDRFSLNNVLMIMASYIVGNLYLGERVDFLSSLLATEINQSIVFSIVFILYLLFWTIIKIQIKMPIKKYNILAKILVIMGGMTYPLYLIHGNIGFIIFNIFYEDINKYILLILVIGLMLLVSYFIYNVLEKRIAKILNYFLNKVLSILSFKHIEDIRK